MARGEINREAEALLPVEKLRQLFEYNAETGELVWKRREPKDNRGNFNAQFAGKRAGSPHCKGYRHVGIGGRLYLEHRVVYALVNGEWPPEEVDHADRNRARNAATNLRAATSVQNKANVGLSRANQSGRKGAHWDRDSQKWCAEIKVNGQKRHLGRFPTLDLAAQAYATAAKHLHGEFARVA
jgi:hypothetical protein